MTTHVMNAAVLPRHLVGIAIATVAFIASCSFGSGWFLPVMAYVGWFAAIIATAKHHLPASQRASQAAIFVINGFGCTLLVSALWLSGRMAQMF